MEYFKCNDDMILALVGEIIRQAVLDYREEIPPITKGMTVDQKERIKQKKHNKATAIMFFRKSTLFRLSQIDFNYLMDAYDRGVIQRGEFNGRKERNREQEAE